MSLVILSLSHSIVSQTCPVKEKVYKIMKTFSLLTPTAEESYLTYLVTKNPLIS